MRTIKVFFIISVYRATVIGAMLTLQTESNVFGNSGTTVTGLYGPQYVVWWRLPADYKGTPMAREVLCFTGGFWGLFIHFNKEAELNELTN